MISRPNLIKTPKRKCNLRERVIIDNLIRAGYRLYRLPTVLMADEMDYLRNVCGLKIGYLEELKLYMVKNQYENQS